MQISELNKDLLAVAAGQNTQKNETIPSEGKFAELLSLSQLNIGSTAKKDDLMQANQGESLSRDSGVKSKEPIKMQVKKQNVQNNEAQAVKSEKKIEKRNKTEKNATETNSETIKAPQAQKVQQDNPNTQAQKSTDNSQNDAIIASEDQVIEITDEALDVSMIIPLLSENVEALSAQNQEEGLVVEQIFNADFDNGEQELTPKEFLENNADSSLVVEKTEIKDVSDNEVEDLRGDVNLSENNKVLDTDENKITKVKPENLDKAIIVEQEEKISAMIPEDKKLEIKVNVEEDRVTTKPVQEIIKTDFYENTDLVVDVPQEDVIDEHEGVLETLENTESNNITPDQMLSIEQDNMTTISPNQVKTMPEDVENILPSQAANVVAVESKTINNLNQINNIKQAYDKGLTKDVVEQIKVNITQSAIKGVDKIEIQLKPESLGQLEIKLHIGKDGRLQAHIIAANAETMELLQKDSELLKEAFNNAGYQTEDESFNFSYRGEEQNNNEREKLREFIGEVLTQDVAEEIAANDYIRTDGVNIRV